MFLLGKTGQNLSLLQISAVETGEEVSAKAAANQLFASKIFEGYLDAVATLKAFIKLTVCKYTANDSLEK